MADSARLDLRVPPALAERIRLLALRERRSVNAQLVILLEQATSASEQQV